MQYHYGNYGFIQHEQMEELPLILLDTGIEKRTDISYHYDNSHRLSYGGYLIQYTLKGCGIYEENGQKTLLQPGMGFFAQMPQNSSYYLPQSPENREWEFFYLHFNGSAARAFWNSCQTQAGSVFTLPLDIFSSLKITEGMEVLPYMKAVNFYIVFWRSFFGN